MIEFGNTLRAAREAKGLTQNDVAQKTHMMIQTVEGLESENFSRIVAPIYGRGFVKLYCEVVGLEPKPMIDAFMELYNGTRSKPEAREAPDPTPPPSSPPRPTELDFGTSAIVPPPAPTPAPRTEPALSKPEQTLSRYAGNLPPELEPRFKIPAFNINWRLATLVAAAFTVLLVMTLAIRAVYRATMTSPEEEIAPIATEVVSDNAEKAAEADNEADAATGGISASLPARKTLPLKPFYIDSDYSTVTERK